ncbi:MAG TPA: adenylate/guanylate cyclase domain-containing protein [Rectinemataceae bacterium]|nr:adenylate/guanylate cyclase domain-containing protein [Rectinemataceae bacterium]
MDAETQGNILALQGELSDLKIMYENVIEHSNALEEDLSQANKTKLKLIEIMRKYVPSQLYDAIVGGKSEASTKNQRRKKLTIFFSDITNFTATTDALEPEAMSELLNDYLNDMAIIASKHGGTVDKFVGDAVMVFFGDPEFINDQEHARRSVDMAIDMQLKIRELSHVWVDRGAPEGLRVRMGINSGYCTVGNFGSETRMDYTIIGGQVNIASRLESVARPGTIVISGATKALVESFFDSQPLGEVEVKGIHHPIAIYRVILPGETRKWEEMAEVTDDAISLHGMRLERDMPPEDRRGAIDALRKVLDALQRWD